MSLSQLARLKNESDFRFNGFATDLSRDAFDVLSGQYDVGVTDHVLSRIGEAVPPYDDPVARQYIPSARELDVKDYEQNDPIGDDERSPVKGVIHRYPDRVLLKVSNICAVYCRYCFRKEMIGVGSDHLSDHDFFKAIDYIRMNPNIWEVILTGGDPLILSARRLQKIMDALNDIDHVKIIRIHTRIPIVNPSKINETILSVLDGFSKTIQMVVHVNHSQEISDDVRRLILSIRQQNVSIFSQSVLLRGVNDDANILDRLFRDLILMHVTPYYLHHLDRAKGSSHFYVSLDRGQDIMNDLRGRISGTALPKYVLDIPGGYGKIPVNSDFVRRMRDGVYCLTDYQGRCHEYREYLEDCAL